MARPGYYGGQDWGAPQYEESQWQTPPAQWRGPAPMRGPNMMAPPMPEPYYPRQPQYTNSEPAPWGPPHSPSPQWVSPAHMRGPPMMSPHMPKPYYPEPYAAAPYFVGEPAFAAPYQSPMRHAQHYPRFGPAVPMREFGFRNRGQSSWNPASTAGSVASLWDDGFSRAGSAATIATYSRAGSAPPSPGRSMRGSYGTVRSEKVMETSEAREARVRTLPYSDPDQLFVTQAYLNNPFAQTPDQHPNAPYTTVQSVKLNPGDDDPGTIVLSKSQRLTKWEQNSMMAPNQYAHNTMRMTPGPSYSRPMMHTPGPAYRHPMMHNHPMMHTPSPSYRRPMMPHRPVRRMRPGAVPRHMGPPGMMQPMMSHAGRQKPIYWQTKDADGSLHSINPLNYKEVASEPTGDVQRDPRTRI